MFSGGASSAVMAKFVADEHPEDTILLYNPTGAEHPDADRFCEEVADFIGLPITVESAKKRCGRWSRITNTFRMIAFPTALGN